MNKIIKNALILAAITLIAGLLLGAAHQVTLEPIQKQQEKEKQESCQNVFPEAASFEEVTMRDAEKAELTAALIGHGFEAQTIDELLLAKDAAGATIGLVEIISTTEGYGGGMQFSMGIASDGTTKGISFLSLSETAGLGMRADTAATSFMREYEKCANQGTQQKLRTTAAEQIYNVMESYDSPVDVE